jgi:hypothetical protein
LIRLAIQKQASRLLVAESHRASDYARVPPGKRPHLIAANVCGRKSPATWQLLLFGLHGTGKRQYNERERRKAISALNELSVCHRHLESSIQTVTGHDSRIPDSNGPCVAYLSASLPAAALRDEGVGRDLKVPA